MRKSCRLVQNYFIAILCLLLLLYFVNLSIVGNRTDRGFLPGISDLAAKLPGFERVRPEPKIILTWTTFFSNKFEQELDWMGPCPDYNCRISSNRSLQTSASAVLFHMRNFNWLDLPEVRFGDQRYIFMLLESPFNSGNFSFDAIPNFFNWTMTYRSDSDIPMPYGGIRHDPIVNSEYSTAGINANVTKLSDHLLAVVRGKAFPVVWFVSNCKSTSRREQYVAELGRHIAVHQYGNCGSGWRNCSRNSSEICNNMLEKDYYFYIAAENSVCKDYITEKLWSRLDKFSVPIVLKRSTYFDTLPQKAIIAMDDYAGPYEMATHLQSIMNDTQKYLEFFDWRLRPNRKQTIFQNFNESKEHGFCLLCKNLWTNDLPPNEVTNLDRWWFQKGECKNDTVLKRLNPGLKFGVL